MCHPLISSGDSRAVMCRGGKCIQLSDDHKPEREDEAVSPSPSRNISYSTSLSVQRDMLPSLLSMFHSPRHPFRPVWSGLVAKFCTGTGTESWGCWQCPGPLGIMGCDLTSSLTQRYNVVPPLMSGCAHPLICDRVMSCFLFEVGWSPRQCMVKPQTLHPDRSAS